MSRQPPRSFHPEDWRRRQRSQLPWAAVGGVVALAVIVVLAVTVRDRQDEIARQAGTIHAQETAIATRMSAVRQQRAVIATQAAMASAQQTAIALQGTAISRQHIQLAEQRAQISALQTQHAALRPTPAKGTGPAPPEPPPALTKGTPQAPLQPLLDRTWLLIDRGTTLQAGMRKGYETLSFRFVLQNASGHAVTVSPQHQVQVSAVDANGAHYALHALPMPAHLPPVINVPPLYQVTYAASGTVPATVPLSELTITVADQAGVAISFTRKKAS